MTIYSGTKKQLQELEHLIQFKAAALNENAKWKDEYYYLDLNDFYSIALKNHPGKSILMSGWSKEEVKDFSKILSEVQSIRLHNNTEMYILERLNKEKNNNNGRKKAKESKRKIT